MSAEGTGLVPGDHPDRIRWNAKYAAGFVPSFRPHPLAARALALDLPGGPVADLACGPSGAALLAAAQGRLVTAVDVSEVALGLLGEEARRRGLGHLITLVHADLSAWAPEPRSHALVLGTGFWMSGVFVAAAAAVADGGLLAWEALTAGARRTRPGLPPGWCLAPDEPASLLPPGFSVLDQSEVPGRDRRRILARRPSPIQSAMPDATAKVIQDLVAEYEATQTPESRVAHDADKIETLVQAIEYQAQGYHAAAWRESSLAALHTDSGRQLAQAIGSADPGTP